MIQKSVCSTTDRPDKGVYQAGFLVLRETSMPSCLIELGFITTPEEEQSLNSDSSVDAIAHGIYLAFVQYKNKYDRGIVVPYKAETVSHNDVPDIVPQTYKQDEPVFKIQIIATDHALSQGNSQFKGLDGLDSYTEGSWVKYTYGASTNYNEIYIVCANRYWISFPMRSSSLSKNGTKMNVNQAIREFKTIRNKNIDMKLFSKEVKIALVAVVGVVILFFGMNFLKGLSLFSNDNNYFVAFQDVTGLSESSPIYADGFKVGVVKGVSYDYGNNTDIKVKIR